MTKQRNNISSPELSIILVNYNGWEWLESCLTSFRNLAVWQSGRPQAYEVIVVDNGSEERKLVALKKQFPWILTKQLSQNVGFSAGNNVGIRMAQAPFIMLLNTDTIFPPQTDLQPLLNHFVDDAVGVVTPKVVFPTGELDHACHRGFPTPWNAAMYFSGVARLFPQIKAVGGYQRSWEDLNVAHPVDACSGAAMVVRHAALDKVGLLDEDYFMYAEDIDWCYRFYQHGYAIWYEPQVKIIHYKHKSGLAKKDWNTRKKTIESFFDTMRLFMEKNYRDQYPRLVLEISFVMIELLKKWKLFSERKHYAKK